MRLSIACAGRAKGTPELELCELYCDRARAIGGRLGFSKLEVIAIDSSREASPASRMEEEAKRIAAKLPKGARLIALDETGRSLSSEAFAKHLAKLRDSGVADAAFLIGGPDGLSAKLKDRAEERLSYGAQTWPHLLVRAMLAEQIYRAFTILSGHPYHRGTTR
jgi:23S rRNA (pseudouridine1915-N3)-methyltransferase